MGSECSELLLQMSTGGREIFLTYIQKFYIAGAVDLQKRLPDIIFKFFKFLDPNTAFCDNPESRIIDFKIVLVSIERKLQLNGNGLRILFLKLELIVLQINQLMKCGLKYQKKKRNMTICMDPNPGVHILLVLLFAQPAHRRIQGIHRRA